MRAATATGLDTRARLTVPPSKFQAYLGIRLSPSGSCRRPVFIVDYSYKRRTITDGQGQEKVTARRQSRPTTAAIFRFLLHVISCDFQRVKFKITRARARPDISVSLYAIGGVRRSTRKYPYLRKTPGWLRRSYDGMNFTLLVLHGKAS